jgi:hypothetical protein
MASEKLIVDHIPHTINVAVTFAKRSRAIDVDEALSVALMQLVKAAQRFRGTDKDGGLFWSFVQPAIAGALVDDIRKKYGRYSRRMYVELLDHAQEFDFATIDARVTLRNALPFLTPRQQEVIKAEISGTSPSGSEGSVAVARFAAVHRMREVLS